MTPEEFSYIKEPRADEPPSGFIEIPIVQTTRGKFEANLKSKTLFTVRVWFLNAEITTTESYNYSRTINPFNFAHVFQSPTDKVTINPKGGISSGTFVFELENISFEIHPSKGGSKLVTTKTQTTVATFAPAWRESETKNQINGQIYTLPEIPALALAILFLSPQLHDGNNSTPEGIVPTFRPK